MKRFLVLIILFVVIIIAVAGVLFCVRGRSYEVTITQAQIDDALKTRFPVTKTYLFLFDVTYSNPKVRLLPDSNRVEVALDADLGIKLGGQAKSIGGSAIVTTGIAYHQDTYQFFLAEPQINRLTVQGIPQEYLDGLTQFASNAAREYIQKYPVYTVEAEGTKSSATRRLLKKVEVKSSKVHATLGL